MITTLYWLSTFCDGASRIVIPLYFSKIGVTTANIGVMFFFYELSGFLTNLFSGILINRIGYKNGFVVALFLHSLSSFLYLILQPSFELATVMIIVSIARSCRGAGRELVETTGGAYLKKAGHSGTNYLFAQVLMGGKESLKGLGVILGGLMLGFLSFEHILLTLGFITLICLIVAKIFLLDYREAMAAKISDMFSVNRKLKVLAWMRALLYGGRDIWLLLALPIYLQQRQVSMFNTSLIIASGYIILGSSQPLFARLIHRGINIFGWELSKKIRYRDALFPTSLMCALIPLGLFFVPESWLSVAGLVLAVVVFNLTIAMATVPHNHLYIKYALPDRSSIDIAYYKTVAQLGKVIASIGSGFLYESHGLYGCMLASAGCLGLGSVLGIKLRKKRR